MHQIVALVWGGTTFFMKKRQIMPIQLGYATPMNILSIDIGGTHVKIRVPNDPEKRQFESGPTLTPRMMVDGVKKLCARCLSIY